MIEPISRGDDGPYPAHDVVRDAAGVPGYRDLPTSVVAAFLDRVREHPHRVALRLAVDGSEITYADLLDRMRAVAGGLRGLGVRPGDRVAFTLDNGVEFVELFLGSMAAGAVSVPINTRLTAGEIDQIVADCQPAVTVLTSQDVPRGAPAEPVVASARDLAAVYYTSGTTGLPKGATSTHEALLSIVESMRRTNGLPDDGGLRTVVALPLFHVTGCNAQLLTTLLLGGTATLQARPDPAGILDLVERHRATFLVLVPALYFAVLRSPAYVPERILSVRWALYGGAPISPDLVRQIAEGFPAAVVGNGFGMSETSSLATMLTGSQAQTHADSIGYPVPVMDVGVENADPGTGVGELVLRGQSVTGGYWAYGRDFRPSSTDGWLRTGDAGHIDEAGRVYLVDRIKDVINRGGENVYSVEVESVLAEGPGVAEVAVVGVADERLGERVGAVLVAREDRDVDLPGVVAAAAARLADFKVPDRVTVRHDPLPRNAGGKVLKSRLRELEGWVEVPRAWRTASTASQEPQR